MRQLFLNIPCCYHKPATKIKIAIYFAKHASHYYIRDMKFRAAHTPIAFIRSIVLAYERYGKDPQKALRAAKIPPSLLEYADATVTARQMEEFSKLAMQELNDEALGWFARALPWGSNGMLCRASLPSANLRIALLRWCRHYKLLINDIELILDEKNKIANLSIVEHGDLGALREFCLVSTLRNIHGFACWLVDSRIPLLQANFSWPPPRHANAYKFMFRGDIYFKKPQTGFSFNAAYLDLPIQRDDQDLRQMLLRPLPLIVLQYRRDRLLSRRIRHILRTQDLKLSNAETLAATLNLSTRSLYRHLAEEDTSIQNIKNEVRQEIAAHLLACTNKPLKQIATKSGFRSEASFSRAFRKWTGTAPSEYRQSLIDHKQNRKS